MAISLGTATLFLNADMTALNKQLGKVQQDFKKQWGNIAQVGKQIGMAMTAIGGAIVGVGALAVSEYIKFGDALQKMSQRIGWSVESLSEFNHVMNLSGSDLGALEKAIMSMTQNMADYMRDGTGEASKALEDLGFTMESFAGMNSEQMFLKLLYALAGVTDETKRLSLAQDIFTKRVAGELMPVIYAGKEGIEAMRQEARDLGLTLGQEDANAAAKLEDALTTLKSQLRGFMLIIAEEIVPKLTEWALKMREILDVIRQWIDVHPELTGKILMAVGALGVFMMTVGPLLMMLPGLAVLFYTLSTVIGFLVTTFGWWLIPIGLVIAAGIELYLNWDTIKAKAGELWEGVRDVFSKLWEAAQELWGKMAEWPAMAWEAIVNFSGMIWETIGFLAGRLIYWVRLLFTDPGAFFKQIWTEVKWVWDQIKSLWDNYVGPVLGTAKDFVVEWCTYLGGKVHEFALFIFDVLASPGQYVQKALNAFVEGWHWVVERTKEFISSLAAPFIWLWDQISSLSSALFNFFSGHFMTGFEAGMQAPAFQSGGAMRKSGLAIVGERGPEAIWLPRGAQVYSHSETIKELSGAGPTVNVTISGNTWSVREQADVDRVNRDLLDKLNQSLRVRGMSLATI